jgi:hypothetical protein
MRTSRFTDESADPQGVSDNGYGPLLALLA